MNPEPETKLAAALHAELRKLPPRRAPANLIAGVLSALAAREARAWWERSWFEWPLAIRRLAGAASGVLLVTVMSVTLLLLNPDSLMPLAGSAAEAWGVVNVLGNAVALLGRAVPSPALLVIGALLATSYLSAIALGTVFYRYAWNRRANA